MLIVVEIGLDSGIIVVVFISTIIKNRILLDERLFELRY